MNAFKMVALVLFVVNLLLVAFAGYKLLTAPPEEVSEMRSRIQIDKEKLGSKLQPSIVTGGGDDEYWDRFQATTYEPGSEEAAARLEEAVSEAENESTLTAEDFTRSRQRQELDYVTDQTPAMNVSTFGLSKESAKLKSIEDQQRGKDALSNQAFE